MKRKATAVGGLAVGLVAFFVPAASATSPDVTHGGCSFSANENATATNGQFEGAIVDHSVTTDANTPPGLVNATVECWIQVNGADATAHFTFGSGTTPVQAGADQITYGAATGDVVTLCQVTHYQDGTGDSATVCPTATQTQIPPQAVIDALNGVLTTVDGVLTLVNDTVNNFLIANVDPVVCPALAAHAGTYGPILIESNGDTSITPDPTASLFPPGLFTEIYDCPPYDPSGG